jgi:hypothetical protein
VILAFWTAGQFFIEKAYVLLVFAGIWALMQGVTDIVRAFQIRRIAEEILDFILRDMTGEKGGFHAALDAEGRDIVLAGLFGASHAMDAFYVAFRIPNLLRDLFAEGAMSAAFVPTFTRHLAQRGAALELAVEDGPAQLVDHPLHGGVRLLEVQGAEPVLAWIWHAPHCARGCVSDAGAPQWHCSV